MMRLARVIGGLIVVGLLAAIASSVAVAHPIDPNWSPPRTVYIPETGQSIDGVFLDFWREGGGASAYGYPITPEVERDGRIVQYYQYARFEYWPEAPDGAVVRLGAIGAELRPHLVRRQLVAPSGKDDRAGREAAAMARAWLPLDASAAKRPTTATWRYVPETGHSVANGFKAWWEATGEAAFLGNPLTEEYVLDGVTYQVFERGQLAWREGEDPWVVPVGELLAKRYKLDTAPVAQGDLPTYSEELFVPPVITPQAGPPPPPGYAKSIVVSLSQQSLWAYEGETVVLSTLVSTGIEGWETPTGLFAIFDKNPLQDLFGSERGVSWYVPDVPNVMYFAQGGFALHGTYWHNNFGTPMSHGCVNLPLDVAEWMFDWAPIGTPVLVVA